MVRACICCKQRNKKCNSSISLYGFPKDTILRERWISAIGVKEKLCESARVCSRHFKEVDFRYSLVGGNRFLKQGAVPSIALNGQLEVTDNAIHFDQEALLDLPVTSIRIEAKEVLQYTGNDIAPCSEDSPFTKNNQNLIFGNFAENSKRIEYSLVSSEHRVRSNRNKYIDDVCWEDISTSPAQAKIYWEVAVEKIKQQRLIIKTLKQKVKRLKTKVADLRIVLKSITQKKRPL